MGKRPTSVTVIGWILIVSAVDNILRCFSFWRVLGHHPANPIPLSVLMIFVTVIAVAVNLVSGIFLLRGANWSRWFCVGSSGIAIVIGLFLSRISPALAFNLLRFLLDLLLWGVMACFLFSPDADAYFTGADADAPKTER